MAWEPFFIAPLEQEMFAWHYSGNISSAGNIGRTTSSHFLFRISTFTLHEPERNYGNVTVIRDWFNVYYAVAEFDSYNSPASTPVMGESCFYNPKNQEDHGFEVLTELYLPYKLKPGEEDNGRFIGVKKLPRKGGQRFFGDITGFGNPWQFGQVMGTVSRRTNDPDQLLLQIYHWTEADLLPPLQHTGVVQQVYQILTLTPQRITDIELQVAEADRFEVVDALLELERRGDAVKSIGRRGEYWSLVVPF